MAIMCYIAVPLTFLQYFFTRERITEERRNQYGVVGASEAVKIKEASFMTQFRACIKDKYWIMLIIMILIYQILHAMKGISQVYYSGWVVNGNAYGEYAAIQARFTMISMAPMGPGLAVTKYDTPRQIGFTVSKAAWIATFMVLFPVLSKLLDAVTNIVMCKVIDSTVCRQGKVRPWMLISAPIVALSIILMF